MCQVPNAFLLQYLHFPLFWSAFYHSTDCDMDAIICGKTAVTWFAASTNQRCSALSIPHFTFRIPHFTHSHHDHHVKCSHRFDKEYKRRMCHPTLTLLHIWTHLYIRLCTFVHILWFIRFRCCMGLEFDAILNIRHSGHCAELALDLCRHRMQATLCWMLCRHLCRLLMCYF